MRYVDDKDFTCAPSELDRDNEPELIRFNQEGGAQQEALCLPAASALALIIGNEKERFGALAMQVPIEGLAAGLYMPMSAAELRAFAATFMQMADDLDNGKGKQ